MSGGNAGMMETPMRSKYWDEMLSLLKESGEFTVGEIQYDSENDREAVERVLPQLEDLGWIEDQGDGTWSLGWKGQLMVQTEEPVTA